jgi:hypothetical protein
MDSKPKKVEIEEEAILMEIEEAERQEIDDRMELEEDETNSSREEDDEDDDNDEEVDREEAMYDMFVTKIKEWDLPQRVEEMRAKEKRCESESEEDTEGDDDDDDDDDEFREICNTKNWCGRA